MVTEKMVVKIGMLILEREAQKAGPREIAGWRGCGLLALNNRPKGKGTRNKIMPKKRR